MSTTLKDITTKFNSVGTITQILKDNGFTGDLSESSPIFQLLVEPRAILASAQAAEHDALRNAWTFLSRDLDMSLDTDQEALVNIFSNLRLSPLAGSKSRGKVRVTFNSPEVQRIDKSTVFFSGDGETFTPAHTYTLIPTEQYRSSNSEFEQLYSSASGDYSALIEIEASVDGAVNITTGEQFTSSLPGVTSIVAAGAFTSGKTESTVGDLLRDIPNLLSEQSMISPVSLVSFLTNTVSDIHEIRVFRSGEEEMRRGFKNALGIATPAADVVLTTSPRPDVVRLNTPGYVELEYNNGSFYNSDNLLIDTELQDSYDNGDGGVLSELPKHDYQTIKIESVITGDDYVGTNYIIGAGVRLSSTSKTSNKTPDDTISGVTIMDRHILRDSARYNNLPVTGSDDRDFCNSSYQTRIKFNFDTTWSNINDVDLSVKSQALKWAAYWEAYRSNEDSSTLESLARAYGVSSSGEMPSLIRIEVPIYADIVLFRGLADIQDKINDESRRCFGQDYLIKSPFVVSTNIEIEVSRDAEFILYKEAYFKAVIANYINSLGLFHSGSVDITTIKQMLFKEGPRGVNDHFDVTFSTRVFMPDGSISTKSSKELSYNIDTGLGVTDRNSIFSCSSESIIIRYI